MTKHSKHKRILALLLSVLMIVSVMTVGISANTDDTIVIDEASDWDEYVTEGGFPENAKVEVSATLTSLTTSFNGNGATVTTNVPLFAGISNTNDAPITIENLTIDGSITFASNVGALAIGTSGNVILKNITNNADISSAQKGVVAGGVVAYQVEAGNLVITACENNGTINCTGGSVHNGGIIGLIRNVTSAKITNCHNNGNVTGSHGNGGIVGILESSSTKVIVSDCTNSGTITGWTASGGIIGWGGNATAITNCVNSGTITLHSGNSISAGGIVGRAQGGTHEFVGCVNIGNVVGNTVAGGILAQSCGVAHTFTYCYNTGTISSTSHAAGIVAGCDNVNAKIDYNWNSGSIVSDGSYIAQIAADCLGEIGTNYVYSEVGVAAYQITTTNGNSTGTNENAPKFFAADIASGKLAYDINTAAGTQVFFQNLTEGADLPTTNAADGTVVKIEDNYYSLRLTTADEASAKIADTADYSGLRFTTTVNAADLVKLPAEAEITYGTRITPTHYLEAVTSFDKLVKDDTCVDVIVESGDVFFEGTSFRGSIVGIKSDNFDMDYSAIGFAKIGNVTVWSTTYSTRNIKEIADAAYNDRSATQGGDYKNVITKAELVIADKPYSPYTESQLGILKGYIG